MALPTLTRRTDWYPGPEGLRGLLFPGSLTLVQLLDALSRRPRWPRRDVPVPVLYLRRPDETPSPLDGLVRRLETARGRRIPFARIDGDAPAIRRASAVVVPRSESDTPAEPAPQPGSQPAPQPGSQPAPRPRQDAPVDQIRTLRPLLDDAVAQLSSKVRGSARLRFPHYSMVSWMLDLPVPPEAGGEEEERRIASEFREYLRRYVPGGAGTDPAATPTSVLDATQGFPWWIRLASGLLPRLGLALLALLWRPPRWIGRQRVGDRTRHTPYRLARAFVREDLVRTHPDAVAELLVGAFLEDLRRGYRKWTLWGTGRRRTAYPWLLVEGVTQGNAGAFLLAAIAAARDAEDGNGLGWRSNDEQSPRFDPLLVVASGVGQLATTARDAESRDAESRDAELRDPADARMAYLHWRRQLRRGGQRRNWVLAFDTDARTPAPGVADRLVDLGPLRPRPALAALITLILVGAGLASVPMVNHGRCMAWWSPAVSAPLVRVGDNCIGISADPLRDFVPDDVPTDVEPALRDVYRQIMEANERAASRPDAIALVYLGIMTPRQSSSYRALIEELRGVLLAQHGSAVPLRVLLANGGERLASGELAAEKILAIAAKDPQLVAVIGISSSTKGAKDAIKRLGGGPRPLAIVGTLTSADDMADINSYYHQVGPNNRREAQVAALYARDHLRVSKVSVFFSADPADRYSLTLAEDARSAFAERGVAIRQYQRYRTNDAEEAPTPVKIGPRACPVDPARARQEAVFFAGRSEHLRDFLGGMSNVCGDHLPHVIAGDSVTRFVLDRKARDFPNLKLHYVSFASPAAWANCARVPFYSTYFSTFGGGCKLLVDGRAALGHDAAQVVLNGVENVRIKDPNAAVRAGLLDGINQIRDRGIQGASGIIRFDTASGVPIDKATLVLLSEPNSPVTPKLLCGALPYGPSLAQDPGCPHHRLG